MLQVLPKKPVHDFSLVQRKDPNQDNLRTEHADLQSISREVSESEIPEDRDYHNRREAEGEAIRDRDHEESEVRSCPT
jgi:hypothetical protein